jgi:hypothetical protein
MIKHFYNNFHYGDCLASLHFLLHLSEVNDIDCVFACHEGYHGQLQDLIDTNSRVKLAPLAENQFHTQDFRTRSGPDRAINLWCCPSLRRLWGEDVKDYTTYSTKFSGMLDLGETMFHIWKYVCDTNDLINPFKDKFDIIFDQEVFSRDTLNKDYDFLLINSYCHSGQMQISPQQQDMIFLQIMEFLKSKNKTFITTHKINNYECTLDHNLSLVKIGQLSKRCKVILGVPTSPLWMATNKWTLENCVQFINYTNHFVAYDYGDKTDNISDLNVLSNKLMELVNKI